MANSRAAVTGTIEIVDRAMADILRTKTEAERLGIARGMWRSARAMMENLLRAQHPHWTPTAVNAEVARRLSHGTP
jgi:hypothetical protein